MENYEYLIGKVVSKRSGKPFKSGENTATVKSIVIHPQLTEIKEMKVLGARFLEDDSIVSCQQLIIVQE